MSMPLVSILIVSYNQAAFIDETLTSALEQTYEPLEVVIADDGSTDGTADIIRSYAERYPDRLRAILGGPRLGVTGNCNRALKACKGSYIAFQGGDDILLPGKIEQQVTWMEADQRRVLCGHDTDVFDTKTDQTIFHWSKYFALRSGRGADDIVRYGYLYASTATMVRTSAIPAYGFDERISIVSDWKLWIDCLAAGGVYGYIPGVFARYRRHSQSLTNFSNPDRSKMISQYQDCIKTLELTREEYPQLGRACQQGMGRQHFVGGLLLLLAGDTSAARRLFIESIKADRFIEYKSYPGVIASLLPYRIIRPILYRMSAKRGML